MGKKLGGRPCTTDRLLDRAAKYLAEIPLEVWREGVTRTSAATLWCVSPFTAHHRLVEGRDSGLIEYDGQVWRPCE